jgi:predicted adenylyl cyclase CyaB
MREVELKAVVDDLGRRRAMLGRAGGKLTYEGRLRDTRYDLESRALSAADEVLRVRRYESRQGTSTFLDWKGPTETKDVYKVREEISTGVEDYAALTSILANLGLIVAREIDREIAQYELGTATIRFETYPRMDTLVEVEGEPEAIESAIDALGMARGEFTSERLADFVGRFERRTGVQAAVSDREFAGDYGLRNVEVRS